MEFFTILYIFIGLVLGYFIAHFKYKSNSGRFEERNQNLTERLEVTDEERKKSEQRANEAEKKVAERDIENKNLKSRLDEQKGEMQDLQKRFKDEFENLANKIFEEKSQKFTRQNKEKLDELLKPLGEKMEAFKKKVEETHQDEVEARGSLKQELKNLMELNQKMAKEANDLTKALKGEAKTQGSWGEVILQRILEKSGLSKGREYEIQEHHTTDDGRRLQPDVVVYLPDEKRLIIDSKVSLTAYERFVSADDETESLQALKQHVASLRGHVKNLSGKNYQQLYAGNSPDFVLMFVPIESAFGIALQQDNSLYYEAFDKNIVIVSPSTLLATLATIDSVWKQEYQSKNAMEIADRGGKLYDKFVNFAESLLKVGERIQQTQKEYETAMGQLSTGHGNVVRQVEMLRELGAKTTKKLPAELTEAYQIEDGNGVDASEGNGALG
ncbi:MAG TPA: DNA recombination protein RmuC [Balneolaceae bacterium]|nr:DNA recombination protein RmuC [Balneolaceae bacterium]